MQAAYRRCSRLTYVSHSGEWLLTFNRHFQEESERGPENGKWKNVSVSNDRCGAGADVGCGRKKGKKKRETKTEVPMAPGKTILSTIKSTMGPLPSSRLPGKVPHAAPTVAKTMDGTDIEKRRQALVPLSYVREWLRGIFWITHPFSAGTSPGRHEHLNMAPWHC